MFFDFGLIKELTNGISDDMTASVLTSHVFGPAKLIFNAGGVGPAKFNIRTDPFAKYMHIYIYIYMIVDIYC